jgi:hypothetical protein
MVNMNETFGDHYIDAYSRADMIEDGSLIDVTSIAKKMGFRYPVALSQAVWVGYIVPDDSTWNPIDNTTLWECLLTLRNGLKQSSGEGTAFLFDITVANKDGTFSKFPLQAAFGPGDDGDPVITIMELEEE